MFSHAHCFTLTSLLFQQPFATLKFIARTVETSSAVEAAGNLSFLVEDGQPPPSLPCSDGSEASPAEICASCYFDELTVQWRFRRKRPLGCSRCTTNPYRYPVLWDELRWSVFVVIAGALCQYFSKLRRRQAHCRIHRASLSSRTGATPRPTR